MALNQPIPVRFEAHSEARLNALAHRFGLKTADLIRLAVSQFIQEADRTGKLILNARIEDSGDQVEILPAATGDTSKKKVNYRDDHKPTRPGGRDKRSDTVKKS